MKFEIEIPDEKVQSLNENGRNELAQQCKKWAIEIIDEAARIEATRNNGTSSEITAAIVNETVIFSKRSPIKRPKPWYFKPLQITAFVSSLVAGSLLDFEKFKDTSQVIWFLTFFTVALTTTVYVTFNAEQNG